MDYKTGHVPSVADVNTGREPQLAIEALLLKKGAYYKAGESTTQLSGVELWKVGGTDDEGYKLSLIHISEPTRRS